MDPPVSRVTTVAASLARPPRVLVAGRFSLADRAFAVAYRSPDTLALHLYDYTGTIRFEPGAEEALAPGHLTISPAGGTTRYHLPRPGHHWCVHYRIEEPVRARLVLPRHLDLGRERAFVGALLPRLCALQVRAARRGADAAVAAGGASAVLQELLCTLALGQDAGAPSRDRRGAGAVERAAAMIAERFAEPLSIPDLARAAGLSHNWLAGRFRARYGMTMQRYQLVCRIDRARFLLTTTDVPVRGIAAQVGIPDPHHFNKQFRRIAGRSPSAVRAAGDLVGRT